MARPRKSGKRAKSGRLSRAHKSPDVRDYGTKEFVEKRANAINGADPQLAATASGILLANGFITQEQHDAALRYARWHSLLYGSPWATCVCPLAHELAYHGGYEPSEDLLIRAKKRIDELNARLSVAQRQAIGNVCIFGFLPTHLYVQRCGWRAMPEDQRNWQALLSGLDALAQ